MFKTYIYDELKKLKEKKQIPFHMPGHKRYPLGADFLAYSLDITEITGYDNLHHPEGIIRKSMDQLKVLYGTTESWYLINGSTVGLLTAISACCQIGDKIVIGRNCHRAVYNMIRLLRLHPIYLYPETSAEYDILLDMRSDQMEQLKGILKENPDAKAVLITSPTYEGIVSDIEQLAEIVHEKNIPLIVDEAHGAHFVFHQAFPKSAIECGADLVIQSTHKTLPCATQTALLHLNSNRITAQRVQEYLSIYETSSPSYLMLASIECGIAMMANSGDKVQEYVDNLIWFREKCAQLKKIHVITPEDMNCFAYDPGKLVISLKNTGMNGKEFFNQMLEKYNIEFEMANHSYCIAMTSVCDERAALETLWKALETEDALIYNENLAGRSDRQNSEDTVVCGSEAGYVVDRVLSHIPKKVYEAWDCLEKPKKWLSLEDAVNWICAEYIQLYPPDIPLLLPGEKIEKEVVEKLSYYIYNGYYILGLENGKIAVLEEG